MDKSKLSERDICTKLIAPAIEQAGWHQRQIREEVSLTDGRVMVRGQLAARISNPEIRGGPVFAMLYPIQVHPKANLSDINPVKYRNSKVLKVFSKKGTL